MKEKKFIVETNDTILSFLNKTMTDFSSKKIKQILGKGDIFVNGKKVTHYLHPLRKGMTVTYQRGENTVPIIDRRIKIIYEDFELLVVDKPAGLLTVATETEQENTMYHLLSCYVKQRNPRNKIFIVHRLDHDTSGIVVFAKNEKIKAALQDNWDTLVKKRHYLALVEGRVSKERGTVENYLTETDHHFVHSTTNTKIGKKAITTYQVSRYVGEDTWLEVEIQTGRKNQIRVHCQEMGHPIVGDKKYGAKKNPFKRLALHADCLVFEHPDTHRIMTFSAPLPKKLKEKYNDSNH